MKLIDVNILLYAIDETSFHHDQVVERWQLLLNGDESVGIPWVVLTGISASLYQCAHLRECP